MKKLLMLIMALMVMFVLTACGDKEEANNDESNNENGVEVVDETEKDTGDGEKEDDVDNETNEGTENEDTDGTENETEENGEVEEQVSFADEAIESFNALVEAGNNEDLETYLSLLVPEFAESSKDAIAQSYEQLDLEVTVLDIEVMEESEDKVVLKVEQETVGIGESAETFSSLTSVVEQVLVRQDGVFKVKESNLIENN